MTAEPLFPEAAPAWRQGVFGVAFDAGPAPGGGIAEALAGVFAPEAGAALDVLGGKAVFTPAGGEPEFTARAAGDLVLEQSLPGAARGIAQAQPDEVEELVSDDARPFAGILAQGPVKNDDALAGEGGRVDLITRAGAAVQTSAMSPQRGTPSNEDRLTAESGELVDVPDYFRAGADK